MNLFKRFLMGRKIFSLLSFSPIHSFKVLVISFETLKVTVYYKKFHVEMLMIKLKFAIGYG